jgi:hypothetical protein
LFLFFNSRQLQSKTTGSACRLLHHQPRTTARTGDVRCALLGAGRRPLAATGRWALGAGLWAVGWALGTGRGRSMPRSTKFEEFSVVVAHNNCLTQAYYSDNGREGVVLETQQREPL